MDVWSSRFTWGGLPLPAAGDFVVIGEGQSVLLDVSTPVLKLIVIQGRFQLFLKIILVLVHLHVHGLFV